MSDPINHPPHYGGESNIYEAIKVIDAWGLESSFRLANAVKYIARARHKGHLIEDIRKAIWYLQDYVKVMGDGGQDELITESDTPSGNHSPPTWTREFPGELGREYFVLRLGRMETPDIVYISRGGYICFHGDEEDCRLGAINIEYWYGPIEYPPLPDTEDTP